jgi:hypothetical protein
MDILNSAVRVAHDRRPGMRGSDCSGAGIHCTITSKIRFRDWNVDQHRGYALGARRVVHTRVGGSDVKA